MRDPRQELVRIDTRGEAHAIGVVASQQLRSRAGTFRLLPSPRHLVVMRYTGEDGQRGPEDGRVVRLCGEIDGAGVVCDVIALIAQAGFRGELSVLEAQTTRSIYFDSGNVVGAQTNLVEERLGEVSYRYGVLSREQLERISSHKQEKPARFGETAVELGLLTREQLYSLVNHQVETIVFSAMTVAEGMFFFLDGFGDARPASNHAVSANALLMDGVTRLDELRYFRQKIPSSDYVPVKIEGRGTPGDEFTAMFAAVDGKSSVEDLGRATGLGEFEATKQLYALVQSHHVAIHPPRPSGGPAALVEAANAALREITSAVHSEGRAAEHRESLASFAVGAGVYELLFRGAGPDDSGALDAEQVVENALVMTAGADSEGLIKQMLHEYVSFALFSAGALLGSEREAELGRKLRSEVASLMPHA